jgi:hypothetical protein
MTYSALKPSAIWHLSGRRCAQLLAAVCILKARRTAELFHCRGDLLPKPERWKWPPGSRMPATTSRCNVRTEQPSSAAIAVELSHSSPVASVLP